jgi:uncharacterized protein (DUF433 family)
LFVQVKGARKDVERELKRLRKVEQMVVSDPEVMGGTPVYRSTRIPVDLVATMVAQGATVEEILEGYPALSREQVELAPLYVAAFPRRGRPARRPRLTSNLIAAHTGAISSQCRGDVPDQF